MPASKDVLHIALEYKVQMGKVGRKWKFPQCSDVSQTYAYRDFRAFWEKCRKIHDLDLDDAKMVVRSIVRYAKNKRLLNSGTALLSRSDIIEICCKDLERNVAKADSVLGEINNSALLLNDTEDKTKFLARKVHRHGLPNLVMLRDKGDLADSYICLSKSCMKVYNSLSDKSGMPPILQYVKMKLKMIEMCGEERLAKIMGDDFNG